MSKSKDGVYVNVGVEKVINNISFDAIDFSKRDSELFIRVLIEPLTKMTSVRFEKQPHSKINFHVLENSKFKKDVAEKIIKKFQIPKNQFVVFNHFSGNNPKFKSITELNFDDNFIIYRNEEGVVTSLLNTIRNGVAHGNIFKCHGGILIFYKPC